MLVGAAGAIAGCGEEDFANEARPAVAKELTGVIQDRGVTVSPDREGAGPFVITISNQTKEPHTVTLKGGEVNEMIPEIKPGGTGSIQKTLEPGSYEVKAGSSRAVAQAIPPGELTVGEARKSSNDDLLLP